MQYMWLVMRESGYTLYTNSGEYHRFFQMACDCKAYCMASDIVTTTINKKTDDDTIKAYTEMTGRRYE